MSVLHNIVMNLNNVMGTRGRYSPPQQGSCPLRKSRFSGPDRKLSQPAQLQKEHCPCILECHLLSTNPLLSALHHQVPKSNLSSLPVSK